MSNNYLSLKEAGSSKLSAFTNSTSPSEKISAVVQVDAAGIEIHKLAKTISNKYTVAEMILPSTLTDGTIFFSLRNPSAAKKIRINSIEAIGSFIGTAAASRSVYRINKFTGGTGVTGTTVGVHAKQTSNPASVAEFRIAPAGITVTGATQEAANIAIVQHANQLTANIVADFCMENEPVELGQNEGIVLRANGAIVLGSGISLQIEFEEI